MITDNQKSISVILEAFIFKALPDDTRLSDHCLTKCNQNKATTI